MYNEKQYKLVNLDTNQIIILDGVNGNVEPRNWDNSDYTYKKSVKTFSETRTYSKTLEFTHNAANFFRNAYFYRDVIAKVQMFEIRFNPRTDIPYEYYIGDFDFMTFTDEQTFIKIEFGESGLSKLIKAKGSTKFELDRTTDIKGNSISDLVYDKFNGVNRPLFLNSLIETSEEEYQSTAFRMRFGSARYLGYYSLPFTMTYESDDSITGVPNDLFNFTSIAQVSAGSPLLVFDKLQDNRIQLFYYNSDRDKTLKVKFDLSFYAKFVRNNNLEENFGSLALVRFKGGESPVFQPQQTFNSISGIRNYSEFIELANLDSLVNGSSQSVNYTQDLDVELKEGDSLGLFVVGGGEFDQFSGSAVLELDFTDIKCNIKIEETSLVTDIPRVSDFMLNRDVGRRFSEILANDSDIYRSNFFNNSTFKYTGITSGEKIRGLEEAKITTSLTDFFNNTSAVFNTGWNTEFKQGKEVIVHEDLKYFFRPEIVIKITEQVSNVKRSVAKELVNSSLSFGYKKPSGENLYEEVQGLNEYNTINEYLTPVDVIDSNYNKTSPYRADSEGKELTYRQHQTVNPTGDYRTDNTIFNLDLKDGGFGIYEERIYTDDFSEAPKNVFSPETCTGLRLSPLSMLKRHSWLFNSSFTKFDTEYIRYSSSIGNSALITKKTGEEESPENKDYQINKLENPIFVSQWIEFEFPLDFDLLNLVNGKTLVDNEEIPNTYFKVEFINEFNKKEYGYLFELKPNNQGKWKLLKAL